MKPVRLTSADSVRHAGQRGGIAIMTLILLPVLIGFVALPIELSRTYNRIAEMQSVADAVALSAAQKLNGTSAGVNDALLTAHAIVESGYGLTRPRYSYTRTMSFDDSAIMFSKSLDGSSPWLSASQALVLKEPNELTAVKIDTTQLKQDYGKVDLFLIRILAPLTSFQVSRSAAAGKRRIKLVPLGICAMSPNAAEERKNPTGSSSASSELTEYGFRRGVSYDLMNLNPNASTPANFLVDPISTGGKGNPALNFALSTIGPHTCTGIAELAKAIGAKVNVQGGFPIAQLYNHLNSRFGISNGQCSPVAAPPDSNVRQYTYSSNSWMNPPTGQVAEQALSATRLETIADLPPPNDQTATRYGPLWAFARAVPWSSYLAQGPVEPAAGYAPFSPTSTVWKSLYSLGPVLKTYPSGSSGLSTPYYTQVTGPSANWPGVAYRRVLNVPLLQCPVSGSQATVLGVGKFFMTVPATATHVFAEFAGTASADELTGPVELYQ